ncbi:hypothetical protein PCANC_05623 [Puccinia coronata f. sp. avenae]|uniref:Uncharacterized protein n=1 Tax=Puccinia coronata f. sp. avenae TaxID=200324 RepID=A0A2N5VJU0_9BASI|nr:hypothetical protein PCASD_22856 [Puccinia coronata f. sp. avenae]PLW50250.1 hypothetical protein PCASD_01741 [Puccinia coronata f. sp. avenae]PLW54494.1 hypothetical protein PCANC_05623 [Puccinia coronata f. sp. avenae]
MSISIKVLEDEDSNITKTDWNMIKFWKSEFVEMYRNEQDRAFSGYIGRRHDQKGVQLNDPRICLRITSNPSRRRSLANMTSSSISCKTFLKII